MYVILDNISPMHAVMHILVNVYFPPHICCYDGQLRHGSGVVSCCTCFQSGRLICLNLDHARNRQLREAFKIIVLINAVMYCGLYLTWSTGTKMKRQTYPFKKRPLHHNYSINLSVVSCRIYLVRTI